MNVTNFKTRLAGFMSRNESDFVQGGVDQLLAAINDARRSAQMRYTFKRLRTEAFLRTSILGADFTTCKLSPAVDGTDVKVKLIEGVFTFSSRSISAGTLYERSGELDFRTSRELTRDVPLAGTSVSTFDSRVTEDVTGRAIAFVKGQKLYTNAEALTWYLLDVVEKLPDLTGSESTDFFLDNAEHWLLFASAQVLNGFLKEDQRVLISNAALERAWTDFTTFDAEVDNENKAVDLE